MANRAEPQITEALLAYLERRYPDRCPDVDETERGIWMNAGSQRVVRHLRKLHESQNALLKETL